MTYGEGTVDTPMRIDFDVPIEVDDGIVLRADVYAPTEPGR